MLRRVRGCRRRPQTRTLAVLTAAEGQAVALPSLLISGSSGNYGNSPLVQA